MIAMAVEELLQEAARCHQAGQLAEAERHYRAVLRDQPGHPFAQFNLGLLIIHSGQPELALAHLEAAWKVAPAFAQFALTLANCLFGLGRVTEARRVMRDALDAGLEQAAAQPLLTMLEGADDSAAAYALANGLLARGEHAAAVDHYRRALELDPAFADAYCNLGTVFFEQGRFVEAEASYRRALGLKPEFAEGHFNLGNTLREQNRLAEAEGCFREALSIRPDYVEVHNSLGVVLREQGKLDAAIATYRQALIIKPDYADVYVNLGSALSEQWQLDAALAIYRQALDIAPEFAEAHQCVATTTAFLSDFDGVVESSDAALRLKSDDAAIWEARLYTFSYHPDLSAADIYAEFVRWGERFPEPATDFSAHDRTAWRRLRVGYVSPDFRRHTSRFYFWPLFANHDHSVVELYAYSNVKFEDGLTARFKGLFDHWRNIRAVADSDVAQMIREDRIDILVDCCNHMQDDRLGVFALKPAPVQATWLGAAWTTGLKTVDYALIDPYMAPEGTLTSETIVRLPHCFVAYQPPEETAEIAPPPCLKNGYLSFGYSGRTERLNHRTFRVWGEILKQLPTARLVLDFAAFADPATQAHYRQFMARHGVDISRVEMRRSANIFEGLNDIDILLDCFPHSGGTMLFDALWMGVPILTLASRPPVGRIGTSLMMNLGLPEWVAASEEDYIAKACRLARDTQALSVLRAGMRERMQHSPVMDGLGFARGMETAYRQMWLKWCASTPAKAA